MVTAEKPSRSASEQNSAEDEVGGLSPKQHGFCAISHLSMYMKPTGMKTAQMATRTSKLLCHPMNATRTAPRNCPSLHRRVQQGEGDASASLIIQDATSRFISLFMHNPCGSSRLG